MKNRNTSLIKNTTILAFGNLCTKGIMFFAAPLFTRWLSAKEYGIFDLLVTYITLLFPLLTFSCGEAIFRFLLDCKDENKKRKILSTTFVIDLFAIIIIILLSSILIFFININPKLMFLFDLYLIIEIIYNHSLMVMRGEKKLNYYTLANIIFVLFMFIFVYIFVHILNLGLYGMLLGYILGDLISIFTISFKTKFYNKIDLKYFSRNELKNIIKYSVPMIPNSISWWIVNVSDRTLITLFFGAGLNAIYSVANKIPSLCTTFFNVFHLSWQQNATETLSDKDRNEYYCSIYNNMISIVTSICILILGFNHFFFKLFTIDYYSGYFQVPILIIAIIFSMMSQFIGGIYVAQMKSKKNGGTTICAAFINIFVNVILIKKLGLYAASLSTLIAYISLFLIRYMDIKKEIALKINNKNMLLFLLLICLTVTTYINIFAFKIFNLITGIICFCIINFQFIIKIFNTIKNKN